MPIYEYKCPSCDKVFEEWTRTHDTEPQPCPDCGTTSPHIVSHTSFVLKGGGWYVSEYGKNSAAGTKPGDACGAQAGDTGADAGTGKSPGDASPPAESSDKGTGSGAAKDAPAPAAATASAPAETKASSAGAAPASSPSAA